MNSGKLLLILGDQLSTSIATLSDADKRTDIVLIAEVMSEARYVPHHKKKIAFIFAAMRHFAADLESKGWRVDYVRLTDRDNSGTLDGEVGRALARHNLSALVVVEPGEWRLLERMQTWQEEFKCHVEIRPDTRFLASHQEFAAWAHGRKQLRMEFFYRDMRRKTGLLMDGDQPVGGKWNFDADNRKPLVGDDKLPEPPRFQPDRVTREVLCLVGERFADHFGDLEPFWFAVSAKQADQALSHFIDQCLPSFGDYQDAMRTGERFLYHSVLAQYMNCGLLDPLSVCQRAERAYIDGRAPINSVEGFIRQIIGWREFVRGIYWREMPNYKQQNFFDANRPLPGFFWTGATDMHCLAEAISQTKAEAYAHHIQRLMVTGNFAMLAGIDPVAVHEWYLSVYADAYEWVELPNVIGMSQFADGGILGSKPYAASGSYIHKMSNYCESCRFDVKKKTGDGACPFNALYWDFLARNENQLSNNQRLRNAFATWRRMSDDKKADYRRSASAFLEALQ